MALEVDVPGYAADDHGVPPGSLASPRLMLVGRTSQEMAARLEGRVVRLVEEGFDVRVMASDDGGFEGLRGQGVQVHPVPLAHPWNLAGYAAAAAILQGHLLELRPMLVHVEGLALVPWVASLARRAGVKAVVAQLEVAPDVAAAQNRLASRLPRLSWHRGAVAARAALGVLAVGGDVALREFSRAMEQRVDRVVVGSAWEARWLVARGLVAEDGVEVLALGGGLVLEGLLPSHEDGAARAEGRRALGLPQAWQVVLGGVWQDFSPGERERWQALMRDVANRARRPLGWVVAVPAGQMAPATRWVRAAGLAASVRIVENEPMDPQAWRQPFFGAIDGLVVLEDGREVGAHVACAGVRGAWTAGVANASLEPLVVARHSGVVVGTGEQDRLAGQLAALVDDAERSHTWGQNARRQARALYDRRLVDERVLELYDRLLAQRLGVAR